MKPMTTETKPDSSAYTVQTPDLSTITVQTVPEQKRPEVVKEKRKRLKIIAISVVVLVIVVAAAISIAFFIAGKQAENSFKTAWLTYKDESGQANSQKVTITQREEKFEIKGAGTAIFDFDKSLLVYRFENTAKATCYVTAVNTSKIFSPGKMSTLIGDRETMDMSSKPSDHAEFINTDVIVPHRDFLSPLSTELCKDMDLMWMVPKPDCVDVKTQSRQKRDICIQWICYYYTNGYRICYWWYIYC